jgi:uncharacterized membrane protein YedE/YeeE
MELVYGAVTGVLFGFLMQKAQVLRYDRQVGALRLVDFTIVKFMLSAVIVSMVGVYALKDQGLVQLSVKTAVVGANVVGGIFFGMGWAIVGYCPATAAGAVGEGRWDALFGILGMLAGAMAYAEAYPLMKKTVLTWGNLGRITLPEVLGANPWWVIGGLTAVFAVLFLLFELRKV